MALALAAAAGDAASLTALGGPAKLGTLKRGNLLLDPDLAAAFRAYAAEADAASRAKQAADLKAKGCPWKPEELERLRRSALLPKGLHVDVPLSLHADRHVGAVYTLFVPERYDPAVPWPLLIGLHGGGPDGKTLDEVVGSGDSAMNFYRELAAQHGVIVACPNALEAPWGTPRNEEFVKDLVLELRLLYHVDVDRIHLTGHSMGGFGTWSLGPKMADVFATLSPCAGGGSGGIQELVETRTPILIYHSDDDYVSVEPDRQAAKRLRETELDFVYTELPRRGHDFPAEVRAEIFDFLLVRRNFDPAYKEAWPRSSFLGKVTPEEKAYLGDPTPGAAALALADHLAAMRLGGGRARLATKALLDAKPDGAAEGLAKIVKDEKLPGPARAEAARALGLLGARSEAAALKKALAAPATKATSALAVEAARALALLADPESGDAFADGARAWTAYFQDKLTGSEMRYSDWARALGTLAAVIESWAAVGAQGAVAVLEKSVIPKTVGLTTKVETSERVPQDVSGPFAAVCGAAARCYAKGQAPAAAWDTLLEAAATDPKAKSAVESARR
jgi:dienelactone hydrolase